jgi:enoyl-CoA hydratase/carnithine racemase
MDTDQFLLSSKTKDFTEGITAFFEKREPLYKGD